MKHVFNKRSGAVVMSPDYEWLGAAVVAGVGSNLTQAQWYFIFLPIYIYIYKQTNKNTYNNQHYDEIKMKAGQ